MNKLLAGVLLVALIVLAAGISQISAVAGGNCGNGGTCGCGTGYAPVVCNGNCTFVNMCHAICAGAKNCKSIRP